MMMYFVMDRCWRSCEATWYRWVWDRCLQEHFVRASNSSQRASAFLSTASSSTMVQFDTIQYNTIQYNEQWRRQDLLRGGAKLEVMSRGTQGKLQGRVQQLLDDLWLMQYWSKELWVVDIYTSWSRRLHKSWTAGCQIYSKVNYKWNCWKSRSGTCPSAQ